MASEWRGDKLIMGIILVIYIFKSGMDVEEPCMKFTNHNLVAS